MTETDKKKPKSFEKSLKDLESIVSKMEKGDLALEEALKQYENGMNLVRGCQQALTDADQRIKLIMEKNGDITSDNFNTPTESNTAE